MTTAQEAYMLMQQQPERDIRIVLEFLKKMSRKAPVAKVRRWGLGAKKVRLPADFDETFNSLDEEIEKDFAKYLA